MIHFGCTTTHWHPLKRLCTNVSGECKDDCITRTKKKNKQKTLFTRVWQHTHTTSTPLNIRFNRLKLLLNEWIWHSKVFNWNETNESEIQMMFYTFFFSFSCVFFLPFEVVLFLRYSRFCFSVEIEIFQQSSGIKYVVKYFSLWHVSDRMPFNLNKCEQFNFKRFFILSNMTKTTKYDE